MLGSWEYVCTIWPPRCVGYVGQGEGQDTSDRSTLEYLPGSKQPDVWWTVIWQRPHRSPAPLMRRDHAEWGDVLFIYHRVRLSYIIQSCVTQIAWQWRYGGDSTYVFFMALIVVSGRSVDIATPRAIMLIVSWCAMLLGSDLIAFGSLFEVVPIYQLRSGPLDKGLCKILHKCNTITVGKKKNVTKKYVVYAAAFSFYVNELMELDW